MSKLGEYLTVKHGWSFKGEYFAETGSQSILTPGNFYEKGGFKYNDGKERYYTGDYPPEYLCKKGDLIVAMTEQAAGLLGSTAIVPENNRYLHNQRVGLVICDERKLLPLYAYYLFMTKSVREQIAQSSSGTKVKHTSPERIYDVVVRIPSIKTQNKVSTMLWSIDSKIQENNHICAELESMAKTIYDYWFTQFDFPNAEGKPYRASGGEMVWNDQLKQKIPKGWKVTSIGQITQNLDSMRIPLSQNERDASKGSIPYYGATGIVDYVNRHIFDGQYVLIAEDGSVMDANGKPIVQMIWGKTWVNNHAHVLAGCNGYSNELLYLMLQHIPVVKIMTGSIQKKINQDNLNNYKIPYIPDMIASDFYKIVKPVFEKLRVLKQESDELIGLRDWLLPLLMNGQVTVADAEEQVSNVIPFASRTVEVRQAARNFGKKENDDTADLVKAYLRRKQDESKP